MTDLGKYADMYAALDVLAPFSKETAAGSFMIVGEDPDGLCVLARLLAAKLCGIPSAEAFSDYADIITYPHADGGADVKTSGKKAKKADTAKAATVNVDDVRDIIDSLYLTPFELNRRVYIIENAESMSDICQNKLLKSLEEPPRHVCFILCASGAMLPTVESRCIEVALPPFSVQTVAERLKAAHPGVNVKTTELAARAGRGNMGMAERIINDPDFTSEYADALKILRLATCSSAFTVTSAVYDKYTRERAAAVLGITEYLLGDVARVCVGAETVFDVNDVNSVAVGFTPLSAARSAEEVRLARKKLLANCMPQAVMDGLILKIMEEKALCRK